ncbi:hypothetical protein L1987_63392 [Smallanthus sonchifolius]|uniref:Uncharacterized protein n=1 Tax=Smallanthus sonchifolius TaxID=185202 RepID=A0ACB9CD66_9ASTR|nr:hypothetical protein L1987_63392 [Smallanthus sonchifolius]
MEVETSMLESDRATGKRVEHDNDNVLDVVKPTSEASKSGPLKSDMSCTGNENNDDGMVDFNDDDENFKEDGGDDDVDDGDYYTLEDFKEDEDEARYLKTQGRFDNVDLPPRVEASFPWLKDLPCVSACKIVCDKYFWLWQGAKLRT